MGNICPCHPYNLNKPYLAAHQSDPSNFLKTQLHRDVIFDICYGGQENTVVSCSNDRSICLYNWLDDQILKTWKGHEACVNKVVYSAKSGSVISCSRDKSIRIWTESQDEAVAIIKDAHRLTIQTIDLNHDGSTLCSGSRDYHVSFWDLNTRTRLRSSDVNLNVVTCLNWIPNTELVVQCSEDLNARIWDSRTANIVHQFRIGSDFALCCATSQDGNTILTGYNGFNPEACVLKLWDLRMAREIRVFYGHEQSVRACSFAPHSERLVSTGKDQSIRIWDSLTAQCISSQSRPDLSYCTSLCFDGKREDTIYMGCANGFVSVWELSAEGDISLRCQTTPYIGDG